MKPVKIEELQKGDLILVRWMDASEMRAQINQHATPEVYVKDWGGLPRSLRNETQTRNHRERCGRNMERMGSSKNPT